MYQKILAKQLDILGFAYDIAKDGNQVTRVIRELELQIERKITPIIAVTGCTAHEEISHCITHGMNECISKPVKLDDLKQLLKKWHIYG